MSTYIFDNRFDTFIFVLQLNFIFFFTMVCPDIPHLILDHLIFMSVFLFSFAEEIKLLLIIFRIFIQKFIDQEFTLRLFGVHDFREFLCRIFIFLFLILFILSCQNVPFFLLIDEFKIGRKTRHDRVFGRIFVIVFKDLLIVDSMRIIIIKIHVIIMAKITSFYGMNLLAILNIFKFSNYVVASILGEGLVRPLHILAIGI